MFKLSLLSIYPSLSVVVKIVTTSIWRHHRIQSWCYAYRYGAVRHEHDLDQRRIHHTTRSRDSTDHHRSTGSHRRTDTFRQVRRVFCSWNLRRHDCRYVLSREQLSVLSGRCRVHSTTACFRPRTPVSLKLHTTKYTFACYDRSLY